MKWVAAFVHSFLTRYHDQILQSLTKKFQNKIVCVRAWKCEGRGEHLNGVWKKLRSNVQIRNKSNNLAAFSFDPAYIIFLTARETYQ